MSGARRAAGRSLTSLQPHKHALLGRVTSGSQIRHKHCRKNPTQINNIRNLCPLLFPHYGSFVGFSLGFNEATVSRKKETQRSRGGTTADIEVKKYLTSVLLQLLLDFTEKSKADALFTVPIVLFTVPLSISWSYSHFSPSHLLMKQRKDTNSIDMEKKQTDETFFILLKIIFKTKFLLTMFFSESKYHNYSSQVQSRCFQAF